MSKKVNTETVVGKVLTLGIVLAHDHLKEKFVNVNIEDVPFSSSKFKTMKDLEDKEKKIPMSVTRDAKLMLSEFVRLFSKEIADENSTPRILAREMQARMQSSGMWVEEFRVYRGLDTQLTACLELDNTREESVNAFKYAQELADFLKGIGVMASILNFSKPQALSAQVLRAILRMHMFGVMPIDEDFMDALLN